MRRKRAASSPSGSHDLTVCLKLGDGGERHPSTAHLGEPPKASPNGSRVTPSRSTTSVRCLWPILITMCFAESSLMGRKWLK
ncbi:hypothetical protein CJO92_19105 (plasmid) [Ralstonia solanacearum]|uniref:Uncharacterized protein n=1 Tax=Ralstonia solanacearum TaxID=305 RepID=A0AAD0WI10_RALSL|nr:hypothetical protein CJO77_19105 [Ralstonia solanacearum]AXW54820.1 hypothetical protein CJO92_19105 [Ralstonia solanacearum]